jgi:hypothetical protein
MFPAGNKVFYQETNNIEEGQSNVKKFHGLAFFLVLLKLTKR